MRKNEFIKINGTIAHLKSKLTYLQQQQDSYKAYIDSCLHGMQNKKMVKKPMIMSKQYYHQKKIKQENNGKLPQFGSYKYTARQLLEKGVLISIDHPEVTVKQYDKIDITIGSDEAGIFDVSVQYSLIKGVVIMQEKEQVRLDDLLQSQFEGQTVVELFDMAKININLLIHLINKKFYA